MKTDNEVQEPGSEPEVREAGAGQKPTKAEPQEPPPEPHDIWARE